MKTYSIKIFALVISFFTIQFLVSCSKDSSSDAIVSPTGDEIRIKININGARSVSNVEKVAHTKSTFINNINNEPLRTIEGSYSDFMLSVGHSERVNMPSPLSKRNLLAENQSASMRPDPYPEIVDVLEKGTKYMVLMYDQDNNHILSKLMTVGEDELIKLQRSSGVVLDDLRFVLFSYNTKDESDYDYINTSILNNNLEAKIRTDREFLYENHSALTLEFDEENDGRVAILGFLLHRMNSKIGVVLDARSYPAKITNAKVKLSPTNENIYFREGTINLRDNITTIGDYVNMSEEELTLSYTNVTGQDTVGFYLYTATNSTYNSISDFKAELTDLTIHSEGEDPKVLVESSMPLDFNAIQFARGEQINARVNILHQGFKIGNIAWAYGNLYYDAADIGNEFKIRTYANEGKGERYTDYWTAYTSTPSPIPKENEPDNGFNIELVDGEIIKGGADPCTKVYPGVWRMPTYAEAEVLFAKNANSGLQFRYDKSDRNSRYVEYRKAGTTSPVLRFYGHGYYNSRTMLTPNLLAAFFINSYTDGSTSWWIDPRALVFTISQHMSNWATADPSYGHEEGDAEEGEDVIDDDSIEVGGNGANSDAITNYDDEVGIPRMNIRCVRTLN